MCACWFWFFPHECLLILLHWCLIFQRPQPEDGIPGWLYNAVGSHRVFIHTFPWSSWRALNGETAINHILHKSKSGMETEMIRTASELFWVWLIKEASATTALNKALLILSHEHCNESKMVIYEPTALISLQSVKWIKNFKDVRQWNWGLRLVL